MVRRGRSPIARIRNRRNRAMPTMTDSERLADLEKRVGRLEQNVNAHEVDWWMLIPPTADPE